MFPISRLSIITTLLLTVISTSAWADIFKVIDSEGRVSYSPTYLPGSRPLLIKPEGYCNTEYLSMTSYEFDQEIRSAYFANEFSENVNKMINGDWIMGLPLNINYYLLSAYFESYDLMNSYNWLKKSAEAGNHFAALKLGELYEFGEGKPQNFQEAMKWYSQAAENGARFAQIRLATAYYLGDKGFPEDAKKAYFWSSIVYSNYTKANRERDIYSTYYRSIRDGSAKKLSAKEMQKTQEMTALWRPKKCKMMNDIVN